MYIEYTIQYTAPPGPLREQGLSKQNSESREHHICKGIAYVVFAPPILGGYRCLNPYFNRLGSPGIDSTKPCCLAGRYDI